MREGYVSPQNPDRDFSNNQNIIPNFHYLH